jgi:hypothetical protein
MAEVTMNCIINYQHFQRFLREVQQEPDHKQLENNPRLILFHVLFKCSLGSSVFPFHFNISLLLRPHLRDFEKQRFS